MKRKYILPAISLILLIVGISIISYPHVCQVLYKHLARQVNEEYIERMRQKPTDDLEQLYQMIMAYNKDLYESGQKNLTDAFAYSQEDFSLIEFGFDEEMIG